MASFKPADPQLEVDGYWGTATTRALCDYFGITSAQRGGDYRVHGQYQPNVNANPGLVSSAWVCDSLAGDDVIRNLQNFKSSLEKDGILGTETIKAIQDLVGIPAEYQDGWLEAGSTTIKMLQSMLNKGSLLN